MNNQNDSGIDNNSNNNKKNSAVALKYENEFKAPKIIAKGSGYIADKIVETAEAGGVFVHTDENLAESLNKLELGGDVPPELFEVVAQIYIFADKIDAVMAEENNKNIRKIRKY
ncbi:MAG: EscU/YscU/HrcU family type III secretion system export apparatus switch protein [Oscillospiraceae bacterium]|nr:EscU/YscU/HrcU family type III secretion system export apparatus switch protein [Oscillospiraceae bacterium]